MLLKPIKGKLQLSDPKLESLYRVGEYHEGRFWGRPCRNPYNDFSYPAESMCHDFSQAISRLVMLAVERISGYYIPGTDFPYLLIAMRMLAKMGSLNVNNEDQLAGLAWVLVYHKFATVEEIREICGDYVAKLVTVERYQKDEDSEEDEEDEELFVIEDKDDPNTIIVPTLIQEKFVQIETSLLLDVLSNIRRNHDYAFWRGNPNEPDEFLYEEALTVGYTDQKDDEDNDEDDDYDYDENEDDDVEDDIPYDGDQYECERHEYFLYGCDAPSKRGISEYDYSDYTTPDKSIWGQSYYKKGFFNQEYTENEYEYGREHFEGEIVRYPYTPEYMAYCDKCRDLFWQRFGLNYEEVEKMLITIFWDGKSPWNPANDLLYEVSKRYHVYE